MNSKTTVVHVNDPGGFDVYIGRAVPRRGWAASPFANPVRISARGSRKESIQRYREFIDDRDDLQELARRVLRGKRLGCWCAPNPCHGDVLAEIADSEGRG